VNGTTVIINPGTIPAEAGTYQVTTNQGAAFPADYTLVSVSTAVDTGIGLTDPGGYFPGLTNVSQALQGLAGGEPTVGTITGSLLLAAVTMDEFAYAANGGMNWEVLVYKGATSYSSVITASTDGAGNANHVEYGVSVTPPAGTFDFTLSVDNTGGMFRLRGIALSLGWSFVVRRRGL
jgi:hypothetical protein